MRHLRVAFFTGARGVRWSARGLHGNCKIAHSNHDLWSKLNTPVLDRISRQTGPLGGAMLLRAHGHVLCISAFESRVSNGYRRSFWPAQSYDLGVELLGKGLDDAGSQPAFRLGKNAIGFAHSVVGDRKLPVRPRHVICNGNLSVFCVFIEGVF
jgi:hypothetical protein